MVTLRGGDVGTGTVTVTATDPGGLNTNQGFNVTVTERPVGVCDRTAQVRDAILAAVRVTDCASVTLSQLAGIDSLDVSDSGLSRLQEDDFELLPELTGLRLGSNGLSQLPRNVFSDLDNLEVLDLSNNSLPELRAGVFSGLSGLKDLEMHGNRLSRLPNGVFSGLSNLRVLGLDANRLSELPRTVFSGLSNLETLTLWQNSLQELPAEVFANLSSLRELDLHANQLSELPRTVFSGLSNLDSLVLSNNSLQELPVGVFAGLASLKELGLDGNQLQSLPRGVFVGLSELRDLALDGNPGSPFGLALRFERTDATSLNAPPPATVRVVLAEGAPFPITVPLSIRGGSVSPASVSVPRGDTVSQDYTVRQTSAGNPARVTAARVPAVPGAITGVELVAPNEIVLFGGTNRRPTATGAIQPSTLTVGSSRTTDVANLFTEPDGEALTFSAVSSAPNIATASTTGSTVRVVAVAAGTATVTVTATDPGGLSASIAFTVTVTSGTANQDRAVLVTLYNATNGPNWSRSDNWLTDADLEDWYGVTLDASGRVRELGLRSNELSGQIPSELGNLSNLESLNLGSNDGLSGEIPSELGNLSNLESLNLYLTGLSGQIPSELGDLNNLTWLNLNSNELSGQIPSELGNLTNLETLSLHSNGLSGQIPPELRNLTNLTSLGLDSNSLTGQIPPELGDLTNLTRLSLRENSLTGQIPPELGDLTNLETLRLNSNNLTGQLPLELANLSNLEFFAYFDTSLCVPNDNSFRTWLNNLSEHRGTGVDCQGAGLIFRDDFNSSSSLDNWAFDTAEGEVSAGIFRVTNTADTVWGITGRELDPPITFWEVRARVGRQADTILTAPAFVMADPGARGTEIFRIFIGTRVLDFGGGDTETINYGLQVFFEPEGREQGWYYIGSDSVDFRGVSDAINDGPGEFTDITVRVQDGVFAALAGEETLFAASTAGLSFGDAITEIAEVHLWTFDPALTAPSLLDWIEVNGVPSGSSANADRDSRPRLAQPDFLRDLRAVEDVPRAVCLTRRCP